MLLCAYPFSGDGGARREREGGIRQEICILLLFFSAEHLAIAWLVKFGSSLRARELDDSPQVGGWSGWSVLINFRT